MYILISDFKFTGKNKEGSCKNRARKSSCMNARGTPSAELQVLALLISILMGGGEIPHPVLNGGYPIQPWMGGEVPHPVLDGGTQSNLGWWGYPIQSWTGGYPHPDLGWGTPISRMGYPPSRPGMGYSPVQTWDGVTPLPIQTWDQVPPSRPWMGYPSCKCEQTENITFPHPSDASGNNTK